MKWEEEKLKLDNSRYLEISLEELVQNTKGTLYRITDFLGVDFDENMLKVDLSKSHSGRWKTDLTDYEVGIIERELGQFMRTYGYL